MGGEGTEQDAHFGPLLIDDIDDPPTVQPDSTWFHFEVQFNVEGAAGMGSWSIAQRAHGLSDPLTDMAGELSDLGFGFVLNPQSVGHRPSVLRRTLPRKSNLLWCAS